MKGNTFFTDLDGPWALLLTGNEVGGIHEVTQERQEMQFLQKQVIMKFMSICRSNDIISVGGWHCYTFLCAL